MKVDWENLDNVYINTMKNLAPKRKTAWDQLAIKLGIQDALPRFKKGGRVKKTGKAILHKGEFILPVGVKPTKAQLKKVAKKRK